MPGVRSAIRRKQREVSRAKKGSKSRGKKKQALVRANERAVEAQRQESFRLADMLVRTYDYIAVEALQIRNMSRKGRGKRGLNRSIAAQGWAEFLEILAGKAERAGVRVVEVSPAGTSQCCSGCGTKVPKRLSERMHCCGTCGVELCRDLNAARNVLERGLRAGGWELSCCTLGMLNKGWKTLPARQSQGAESYTDGTALVAVNLSI